LPEFARPADRPLGFPQESEHQHPAPDDPISAGSAQALAQQAKLGELLPDRIVAAHPELYVGDPDTLPALTIAASSGL